MTNSHAQRRLPECNYCMFYADSPHLVCAIHPQGPSSESCLDFREDDHALKHWSAFLGLDWHTADAERWQPDGEPINIGEFVLQPQRRLSVDEQMQLTDSHPIFTNRCPDCDYHYRPDAPPPEHWECPRCGWSDRLE
ncbi:MAG: hypothetical protein ACFE0I_22130 [Elainellaceae cyanobacterium]